MDNAFTWQVKQLILSLSMFNVPGAMGPNRQKLQFSEFMQSKFAAYMQNIP